MVAIPKRTELRWLWAGCLALLLCAAEPAFASGMVAKRHLATAKSLTNAGRHQKALNMLDKALAAKPGLADKDAAEAWLYVGINKSQIDDVQGAVAAFGRVISLNPRHYKAYLLKGMVQDMAGQPGAALDTYKAAAAVDPSRYEAHHEMGMSALMLGDREGAAASMAEAAKLAPTQPEVQSDYGYLLVLNSRFKEAIAVLEAARKMPGSDAELESRLGDAYAGNKELKKAREIYGAALAKNPRHARSLYRRGLVSTQLGDHAAAEKDYSAAAKIEPKASHLAALAGAQLAQGREDEARATAHLALQRDAKHRGAQKILQTLKKK